MTVRFSDVQNILDAILARNGSPDPQPHGVFWRQSGNYEQDYRTFTTGTVPNMGIPIMNTTKSQELTSNFYVILTNKYGLEKENILRMPSFGPFITDSGYQATVNGTVMTGREIQDALAAWLSSGFPK